jgi:hypothetical protein
MRPDGESRQGRRNTTCIQQHMRTNFLKIDRVRGIGRVFRIQVSPRETPLVQRLATPPQPLDLAATPPPRRQVRPAFPPSDGDCHTPLPCEVREGTVPRHERAVPNPPGRAEARLS